MASFIFFTPNIPVEHDHSDGGQSLGHGHSHGGDHFDKEHQHNTEIEIVSSRSK